MIDNKEQQDWKPHTKMWMESFGDDPKDFPYKPEPIEGQQEKQGVFFCHEREIPTCENQNLK